MRTSMLREVSRAKTFSTEIIHLSGCYQALALILQFKTYIVAFKINCCNIPVGSQPAPLKCLKLALALPFEA